VPFSLDSLHGVVQAVFSTGVILFRYFWWLILVIIGLRSMELLLRLLGFDKRRKPRPRVAGGRPRR